MGGCLYRCSGGDGIGVEGIAVGGVVLGAGKPTPTSFLETHSRRFGWTISSCECWGLVIENILDRKCSWGYRVKGEIFLLGELLWGWGRYLWG